MKRRNTKQKTAILQILQHDSTHPTAEMIYRVVKKEIPGISLGTVYRNLQTLEEDGLITELNLNGTQSRYEYKQAAHYHFRCEKCSKVSDLDEPVDSGIDRKIEMKTGFQVTYHETEFRGLCLKCQKTNMVERRKKNGKTQKS